MIDAPSHKLTRPGGERLPPLVSPFLRLLTDEDWLAFLDGHVTENMARVCEALAQPVWEPVRKPIRMKRVLQ